MKICGIQFKAFSRYGGLSVFAFCLLLGGLLFTTPAKAAEIIYINNSFNRQYGTTWDIGKLQVFQVVGINNILKIRVPEYYGDSNTAVKMYICKVESENSTTCLDTPVSSIEILDWTTADSVHYYTFNYEVSNGYYAITVDKAVSTVINDICSGTNCSYIKGWGGQQYYKMPIAVYYDDAYTPPPTGYCGDGICNNGETGATCIDCLTFYDMKTLQDTYLWFDNTIEYCPVNTSCAIKYYFDTSIFNPSADYGKLYYYESSTSTPDYLGIITPLATSWELGDLDSGTIIASSTATSTHFSYYAIVPCKTFGEGGCWGTSTIAIWYSAQVDYAAIVADIWPATSSTSTEDFIGDFNATAYHLTCSDEDWAGDWWTRLGCSIRFGEIIIQNRASEMLSRTMSKAWSALKNMFPFNFANLMNTSWSAASVSGVPAELSFLDMLDDEGNISFDFSAMTGATTTLTFWGANTFDNTNGEFTKIRTISKYIFYGLLFLYIYLKGKHVYNELSGNNSTEND